MIASRRNHRYHAKQTHLQSLIDRSTDPTELDKLKNSMRNLQQQNHDDTDALHRVSEGRWRGQKGGRGRVEGS